jgi:hypothetical protein
MELGFHHATNVNLQALDELGHKELLIIFGVLNQNLI